MKNKLLSPTGWSLGNRTKEVNVSVLVIASKNHSPYCTPEDETPFFRSCHSKPMASAKVAKKIKGANMLAMGLSGVAVHSNMHWAKQSRIKRQWANMRARMIGVHGI